MVQKLAILNQAVDTMKIHVYPNTTNEIEIDKYNQMIDDLKQLKYSAQEIHHSNNDLRFLKTEIGEHSFNVMATTTKGFSVTLQNNDLSMSFKKITHLNQNPIIKVEFATMFLYRFGAIKSRDFILDFIKSNIIANTREYFSELHLCTDVQGYEFSQLDLYRLQKPTRKNALYESDSNNGSMLSQYFYTKDFTGFAFGGGDNHLRIYDKTKEIKIKKNKDYIKAIWGDKYDESQSVWRIEHQLRRKVLKDMYIPNTGIRCDSMQILEHIEHLWSYTMEKYKLKDIEDDKAIEHLLGYRILKSGERVPLKQETVRTRFKRADLAPVWQLIQKFKGHRGLPIQKVKEIAANSIQYVKNSLSALLSTMLKHFGKIDGDVITKAFTTADEHKKLDKGHGILDDIYLKSLDYMHSAKKLECDYGIVTPLNNDIRLSVKNHLMECLNLVTFTPTNKNTIEAYIKKIDRLGA